MSKQLSHSREQFNNFRGGGLCNSLILLTGDESRGEKSQRHPQNFLHGLLQVKAGPNCEEGEKV